MEKKNNNIIIRLSIALIFSFLIITVINIQKEMKSLKDLTEEKLVEIQDLEDSINELTVRLNTPLTPEYMERVARERLGYRNSNEIIFYNDVAE